MIATDVLSTLPTYMDIDDVVNLCVTDKNMYDNVCNQRSFWQPILKQHHYPLPKVEIDNTSEWIKYFFQMKNINHDIRHIVSNLNKTHGIELIPFDALQMTSFITLADQIDMISEKSPPFASTTLHYIGLKQQKRQFYLFLVSTSGGYQSFIATRRQVIKFLFNIFQRHAYDVKVTQ